MGVELGKKPKDLTGSESEEHGPVGMGRVGGCILLRWSQIHYNHMVTEKQGRVLPGVDLCKKPKDLSASERQDRGHGKGVGVYVTLLQSHTLCKALNY